jgi:hypothetical protein
VDAIDKNPESERLLESILNDVGSVREEEE